MTAERLRAEQESRRLAQATLEQERDRLQAEIAGLRDAAEVSASRLVSAETERDEAQRRGVEARPRARACVPAVPGDARTGAGPAAGGDRGAARRGRGQRVAAGVSRDRARRGTAAGRRGTGPERGPACPPGDARTGAGPAAGGDRGAARRGRGQRVAAGVSRDRARRGTAAGRRGTAQSEGLRARQATLEQERDRLQAEIAGLRDAAEVSASRLVSAETERDEAQRRGADKAQSEARPQATLNRSGRRAIAGCARGQPRPSATSAARAGHRPRARACVPAGDARTGAGPAAGEIGEMAAARGVDRGRASSTHRDDRGNADGRCIASSDADR